MSEEHAKGYNAGYADAIAVLNAYSARGFRDGIEAAQQVDTKRLRDAYRRGYTAGKDAAQEGSTDMIKTTTGEPR